MLRNPLQRVVLAFVLALGGLAVVSSLDSCRRIDILNPKDSNDNPRDTSNHRDTTGTDTTVTRDTGDMVINGEFDSRTMPANEFPSPWGLTGPVPMPPMSSPLWSSDNGCGNGNGSTLFNLSQTELGLMQEMAEPFLANKMYKVSLCSKSAIDSASNTSYSAEIDIMTSQDGGITLYPIATFYTNSLDWSVQSQTVRSPVDSKTVYIYVHPLKGTIARGWAGVDNLHIYQQ